MSSLLRPRSRLVSTLTVLVFWTFSTAVLLYWGASQHDTRYYWRELEAMPRHGVDGTLTEYPVPVLGGLLPPWLLANGSYVRFLVLFVALMVLLDAIMTVLLLRREPDGRNGPALFWTAFVALLGPLVFLRFDMVTAAAVGTSLILATRWPASSGAVMAVGAAIKLWPVVVVPALLGRIGRRTRVLAGVLVVGVSIAAASWLAGGWQRLVSPLRFQVERGLQIESVWATPVMIARAAGVSYREGNQTMGPGVPLLLTISSVGAVLGFLLIGVLAWRALRLRSGFGPQAAALLATTIIAILIVTNKVLSPQYLLWLAAPLALVLRPPASDDTRVLGAGTCRWLAIGGLVLAVATQLEYNAYHTLGHAPPGPGRTLATGLLVVRNVLLVAFTCWLAFLTWRQSRGTTAGGMPTHDGAVDLDPK